MAISTGRFKGKSIPPPLSDHFDGQDSGTAPRQRRNPAVSSGIYYPDRSAMPANMNDRLEDLAFRFGRSYDTYTVVEPRCHCFFAPDKTGAVCFYPSFAGYHVVGGLIASEANKAALLDAFCRFCDEKRRAPYIYNIQDADLPLFRERGFELTKWGEDPVVDLQATDWSGKKYEWIRRQENYCLRQGLSVREVSVGNEIGWPALRREMEAISQSHIKRTAHGRELKVFQGSLSLDQFNRRRLFVAQSEAGLQGLVVCNPSHAGRRWSFEIYRRADDAPRGTVAFLFLQTMRALKAEGAAEVSLSLVPALNCVDQPEFHSKYFAWLLRFWWNRLNWLFDFRGLYHFKSRFRPRYDARYIAAHPHFGAFASITFAAIWGVLKPHPMALARHVFAHVRKGGLRTTLAKPE